jgi:hypothetical protein
VAVASRAAMMGDETHDAWVAVFAAITKPPPDTGRAACPNCGRFAVRFRYLADVDSRVGLCALWCENCGHGHTLSRVEVPEGIDFVPLDAPKDVLRSAIPDFYDAAAHESAHMPISRSASGSRITELRSYVAEYELLTSASVEDEQVRHVLTRRELEVVRLLSEGGTVTEVANTLDISPATVRSHMHRIYWKLGRTTGWRLLDIGRRQGR